MHLLSSMGRVKSRRIGRHADRSAHKLAKHPAAPHVFYSSGEDGDVRRYDIRERNAGSEKILTVFSATRRRVRPPTSSCSSALINEALCIGTQRRRCCDTPHA